MKHFFHILLSVCVSLFNDFVAQSLSCCCKQRVSQLDYQAVCLHYHLPYLFDSQMTKTAHAENTVQVTECQFMQQLLLWYCIQECDLHYFCVLVHYSYKYFPLEAILIHYLPDSTVYYNNYGLPLLS